jgi:hypothetical protein
MAVPTLTVRIDWNGDGDFSDAGDDVSAYVLSDSITWTRGRNADFSGEATGSASFTLRNDAGTFLGAGSPLPGMPVHIQATYGGSTYPQFFGFVERVAPDPREKTVTVTCYDVLKRMSEVDTVIPYYASISRTARDYRLEALADYERGARNLLTNPSFEVNTTGWTNYGGSFARIATDAAPAAGGSCCGEFTWTTGSPNLVGAAYLAPVFYAGVVYRASAWLRSVSGTVDVQFGLGYDQDVTPGDSAHIHATLTTTWTRHTVTFAPPTTRQPAIDANGYLLVFVETSTGSYRIDGAQVTRGQGYYSYADSGTGRWPNWCGTGSFDAAGNTGWHDGWKNLCTNGSFEVDTTGWTGVTRSTAQSLYGSASGIVTNNDYYTFSGTFLAGVQYDVRFSAYWISGGNLWVATIASAGTPADAAHVHSGGGSGTWATDATLTWTPTANRSDVRLTFTEPGAGNIYLDGVMVTRRSIHSAAALASYSDTGPGGGGSFTTSDDTSTAQAKYGVRSEAVITPATATAGVVYDFYHVGPIFVSGQPYTLSLWLRAADAMPYKVGMGGHAGDGTWDEASVTGTLTANTWTQVTATWTPTADRLAHQVLDVVLFVYQTDATARTFYIDGVRVIPGAAADDFEMTHWALGTESDVIAMTANISGTVASALSQFNDLVLTRHWIEPQLTAPWYSYVTSGRDDLAAKTSAETFDDDLADMSSAEIDRASIVNVVSVSRAGGTSYYGDPDSNAKYGPRPGGSIQGSDLLSEATANLVGPALVARYKDPRARPQITVVNRFPSQLVRELDDLVTVNFSRLSISGGEYLIQSVTTSVSQGGNWWETVYQLEEAP